MELQWLSLYILKVYTSGNMLYLHTCCLDEVWPGGMIAGRPALVVIGMEVEVFRPHTLHQVIQTPLCTPVK